MIDIIWGSIHKPVATRRLADFFELNPEMTGTLYVGYPIISTPEGPFPIDALLLSPEWGLVAFHIVEGKDACNFAAIQDEIFNNLSAKLRQHKSLLQKRELMANISVVTFAPAIPNIANFDTGDYPVRSQNNLAEYLNSLTWDEKEFYPSLVAAIQSISTIRKGKKQREIKKENSRGAKLKELEDSIANLDNFQGAAVIETVEGVQRIRGLAGSGKTIVLALKVAYLHAQNPSWSIAVTFNTRSLKGQFERFINTFVIEQGVEPDWEKLQILHAWGAPGDKSREGLYYNFCKSHGVTYFDFNSAKKFGAGREFEGACENALLEASKVEYRQLYDVIVVDEAQDFSPHFLRLCYELLKEPKRLVYAYDELQNLNSRSLPPPEEIFGNHADGTARVKFSAPVLGKPRQDIILEKCYRNSRPVLATAHALGFGIYRKPDGLIQMFENIDLWKDIGYKVADGSLEDGEYVCLERTADTSPEFLENHSPIEDLIQFKCFDSYEEQDEWLANSIAENITTEELHPEDIIVINPDPLTTRNAVADVRSKLLTNGINSNIAGVSTSPDVFFQGDAVTFTGIFRAKGNEAAMVYVMNAQDCYTGWGGTAALVRNRLFTAITRSKGWVRVCGVGKNMAKLAEEFDQISKHNFQLAFKYPTAEERAKLTIVNRDMSNEEKQRLKRKRLNLEEILESLEAGDTVIEDYPKAVIIKLRRLLSKGSV